MKARLKGAQTGRNLLKKKADALSMRFRQILRKIIEVSPNIWPFPLWFCMSYNIIPTWTCGLLSLDQDPDGRGDERGGLLIGWG